MTVRDHLAFALVVRRWTPERIDQRVHEMAALLGIERLLSRMPTHLSGGEAERVALGRALAFHPRILLLDEPLSALDERTRDVMQSLLKRVQRETGVTTLHVTHSGDEARKLCDRLLILREGTVRAVSSPEERAEVPGRGETGITNLADSTALRENVP
jgi:ABC-type sulfate/molybdate transport systems ATPase subunit